MPDFLTRLIRLTQPDHTGYGIYRDDNLLISAHTSGVVTVIDVETKAIVYQTNHRGVLRDWLNDEARNYIQHIAGSGASALSTSVTI